MCNFSFNVADVLAINQRRVTNDYLPTLAAYPALDTLLEWRKYSYKGKRVEHMRYLCFDGISKGVLLIWKLTPRANTWQQSWDVVLGWTVAATSR